jgi:glycosyltransferase involved in cell wall biosynthesis
MKNRVVFVVESAGLGGGERRWIKIITKLYEEKQFEFAVLISGKLIEKINESEDVRLKKILNYVNDYNFFTFNDNFKIKFLRKFFKFQSILFLGLILKYKNFNVIHSVMNPRAGYYLKKLYDFKFIHEVAGPEFAKKFIYSKYSKLVDGVVCVSKGIEEILKKNGFDKIIHSYSIPYYEPVSIECSEQKDNIVVFAHRFLYRKNVIFCSFIFREISNRFPNWRFYILGKGDKHIEQYIKMILKDNPNVIIQYLSDISPILKKSKIFLSLNKVNNFPSQSVMEALNFNNYLILTDTGQSCKFLNGKNGNLIIEDLDDAIDKLAIAMKMDYNKYNESFRYLTQELSYKKFLKELNSIYLSDIAALK